VKSSGIRQGLETLMHEVDNGEVVLGLSPEVNDRFHPTTQAQNVNWQNVWLVSLYYANSKYSLLG